MTLQMLAIVYILCGVMFIVMGIPLMRGAVKQNRWYGFRVRQTLEDPNVWYPVNARGGRWLIVAGIITIVAAILLLQIPGITVDAYVGVLTAVMTGSFFVGMALTWRYIRSLSKNSQ